MSGPMETFAYNSAQSAINPFGDHRVIRPMEYIVMGVAMRRFLKVAVIAALLSSLTACVVVPPSAGYVGPGVAVVTPAPYGPWYGHHHRGYHRDWDRRW